MGKQKHQAKKKRREAYKRLSGYSTSVTNQQDAGTSHKASAATRKGAQPFFNMPICYSDLKNSVPPEIEIDQSISSLRKRAIFFILIRFNMLLSMYERDFARWMEIQKYLLDALINNELYALVRKNFAQENSLTRPLFHRQQLLALMKRILLESTDANDEDYDVPKEEAYLLGKIALIINNLIYTEEQGSRLSIEETGGDSTIIRDELCTQMLPSYELSNPPDVHHGLIRSYEYFRIFERMAAEGQLIFKNGQSVPDRFLDLTGLRLNEYLLLILSIYLWYQGLATLPESPKKLIDNFGELNFRIDALLDKMKFNEGERRAFLRQTTTNVEGLIEALRNPLSPMLMPQYDFTAFRTFPLIYTHEGGGVVTCLDSSFLAEKISVGVYHKINQSLTEKSKEGVEDDVTDQKSFLTFWGTAFEIYTNERLREVRSPGLKRIFTSPEYETPPKQGHVEPFDALLDYGQSLVVFEHKGKYIDLNAKYSGRRDLLLGNLMRGDRIGKGILQLADNIEYVFSQRHTFREGGEGHHAERIFGEKDISRVRRIYPVIVHQDFPLRLNCVNVFMGRIFRDELGKRDVNQDLVRPLSILSVEDVEILIPYLIAIPFPDVLEEYARYDDPLTSFKKILYNLLKKRRIKERQNQWMEERFEELRSNIRELFIDLSDD